VSCALYTFTQIGILALLTLFLFNERGWDPRTAALIYSIVMASAIGSRIAVGHLADRLVGGALRIYRVIGIVTALLLIASAATAHFSIVVPLIVLAAISGMTWNPLIFALTVQAVPPARLGATQGVVTSVIFLGAGLAPIVIAPITSATSWSVGWLILAAACIVGAVIARVGKAQSR
jgi:sugar phosphate permease